MSQAVGEERRAGRDRAPGEVGNEEADDQAIGKPHPEELGHGGWTAGKDGQHPYGSLLEFFYGSGRLHLFVGAKREMIETALQTSGAQGGKKLVLFGELTVVAAMVRQQHVHDGAGDEDDDGGEKNREPKSREGNHAQPPWDVDECRGCPHKRVSPHRSRGQVWTRLLDTKSLQVGATFPLRVVVFVGCWTVRGKTEDGTDAREDDGGGIVAAWL